MLSRGEKELPVVQLAALTWAVRPARLEGEGMAARDPRIDSMYRSDSFFAWLFVALLWLCIGFVFYEVWGLVDDTAIRVTLAIGGVLLLLFNTASIGAMVAHYADDKDFIYGLDLKHQDALEASRRGAVPVTSPRPRQA
jgi:hypothetical protein